MGKEIERKFLVRDGSYKEMARKSIAIRQAYISANPDATVRVRVGDDRAWLTVKGRNRGAVRDEWEWPIAVEEASAMATRLADGWSIDKTRYLVDWKGRTWEVDEFHGRHEGLTVAEVELPAEDADVELPPFVGAEVTGDPAYYNSTLSANS